VSRTKHARPVQKTGWSSWWEVRHPEFKVRYLHKTRAAALKDANDCDPDRCEVRRVEVRDAES